MEHHWRLFSSHEFPRDTKAQEILDLSKLPVYNGTQLTSVSSDSRTKPLSLKNLRLIKVEGKPYQPPSSRFDNALNRSSPLTNSSKDNSLSTQSLKIEKAGEQCGQSSASLLKTSSFHQDSKLPVYNGTQLTSVSSDSRTKPLSLKNLRLIKVEGKPYQPPSSRFDNALNRSSPLTNSSKDNSLSTQILKIENAGEQCGPSSAPFKMSSFHQVSKLPVYNGTQLTSVSSDSRAKPLSLKNLKLIKVKGKQYRPPSSFFATLPVQDISQLTSATSVSKDKIVAAQTLKI